MVENYYVRVVLFYVYLHGAVALQGSRVMFFNISPEVYRLFVRPTPPPRVCPQHNHAKSALSGAFSAGGVLRGRSALTPRSDMRADRAPRIFEGDEYSLSKSVLPTCRGVYAVEPLRRRRGVERPPRWATTQPRAKSAVRVACCVGGRRTEQEPADLPDR